MFDAEKRALELLLKGKRVGRYILKNYQYDTQTIWYVHGAVAFRPHMDFINPKMLPDDDPDKELFPMCAKVINNYQQFPSFYMVPQKPVNDSKGKPTLIPMLSSEDDQAVLKYLPQADIRPWLNKRYRYVYVPDDYSWKGGVFLVINEHEGPFPVALINPVRKES